MKKNKHDFYSYWDADDYKQQPRKYRAIEFHITSFCNMKCPECAFSNPTIEHPEHCDPEAIKEAASNLYGMEQVSISGGEPTAHPQFQYIAPRLKEWFGCRNLTLITNGYKLMNYTDILSCFDDILLSHYPHNQRQIDYLARHGLDKRSAGPSIHLTTARRARRPKPCCRANFLCYRYNRLYLCCHIPTGWEANGIPVTKYWREEILKVPLPCADCCFAEEDKFSPARSATIQKPVFISPIQTKVFDPKKLAKKWPQPRPDIAIYGLYLDSWMAREAEIRVNTCKDPGWLLVHLESHAPEYRYPITLTFENEFFKKTVEHIVTAPGKSIAEIGLLVIPRHTGYSIIKVRCDKTFYPGQEESMTSQDDRELGIRVTSLCYDGANPLPNKGPHFPKTAFEIVKTLIPFITHKTFIDIGAQKGSFATFTFNQGLAGVLFEPCPKYHAVLSQLVRNRDSVFLDYAIDEEDREADFFINYGDGSTPADSFHSLCYMANDPQVRHRQKIRVTCRSLQSLFKQGVIDEHVGILKIEADGNDLRVLKGVGAVKPEVLICQFYTKGLYPQWEDARPREIITEAQKLGFSRFAAIKRYHEIEQVTLSPASFSKRQWGTLIFINDEIYARVVKELQQYEFISENKLLADLDLKDAHIRSHRGELADRDKAIKTQVSDLASKDEIIKSQHNELIEKNKWAKKLRIFKFTSLHYWITRLGQPVLKHSHQFDASGLLWFKPKLEQFHQYHPIPLKLPQHYHTAEIHSPQQLPVVSIVTPSFNYGHFLEHTIKSVLDQNYPNLEYIIQDGASTDGTSQLLDRYAAQLSHVESCKDKGQANAINMGFRHASGDIMAWLNSDDLLLPGTIAYIVKFFSDNPQIDVVYGHRIVVDDKNREIGRIIVPPHDDTMLLCADYIPQETLFWRKRIWEKSGGIVDESFHFAIDWELLLRFRSAGAKFECLPRFLGAFRVHPQQKTSAHLRDMGIKEMSLLRRRIHGRDISQKEIRHFIRKYRRKHFVLDRLYRWGVLKY